MNKRNKLIWNILALFGIVIVLYAYIDTFIYNSDLKWSAPGKNNKKSQWFGGYQKYTKDARTNAESDNNKSSYSVTCVTKPQKYNDFSHISPNFRSEFIITIQIL